MSAWPARLDRGVTSARANPKPFNDARSATSHATAASAQLNSKLGRTRNPCCRCALGKNRGHLAQHSERIEQLGHEDLAAKFLIDGEPSASLPKELMQQIGGRGVTAQFPTVFLASVGTNAFGQLLRHFA